MTRDPEPSPDRWKEVTNQPANQPTNQPHLDFTSSPKSHPWVTPPPPPHSTLEAPTAPPSHLIRWEGGFSSAYVRAGQEFEALVPRGARVNLHSLRRDADFLQLSKICELRKTSTEKLYQHRPLVAWKGINHFRNLLNRFKKYKFQFL